MVQKTGFGKSLCYQFPATQFENMTIVFSPLLSLMRDQINKLINLGIATAAINSEQEKKENEEIIENAKKGMYKLLYIAPERQESIQWIDAVKEMNISMVVIDEAHYISTWGHDFRPSFRRIIEMIKLLPVSTPIIATTATATNQVVEDILKQIPGNVELIRGNLMRDNFALSVIHVDCRDAKLSCIAEIIKKQSGFGIIYTGTRTDTDIFTRFLLHKGISCTSYHAGRFHDEFHPVIELVSETESKKPLEDRKLKLTDGVAFSYYGTSQIGHIGDFKSFGREVYEFKPVN